MAAITHQTSEATKEGYYCDGTCRDCNDEKPMLVEFTEQNGKRLYMCRDCYDELAKVAPSGLYGAKILCEDPEYI